MAEAKISNDQIRQRISGRPDRPVEEICSIIASSLGLSLPISDPDGDDADIIATLLTDLLEGIVARDGDWRQVIAWARDPRTAVQPEGEALAAARAHALIACLDADAQDGEARMRVIRRAIRDFRAEHLDPDGGILSPDGYSAEEIADALGLTVTQAQRRLDAVAWGSLSSSFWG